MKYFIIALLSLNLFSYSPFAELRVGFDAWGKTVQHKVNGELAGFFIGPGFGLRLGMKVQKLDFYLELNPKQNVEISSANELAKVKSYSINARYFLSDKIFLGPHIGHASFELEKGPDGIRFPVNPESSSFTFGLIGGAKLMSWKKFYLITDALLALGPFNDDGPATTPPIESINASPHFKINLNIGYQF